MIGRAALLLALACAAPANGADPPWPPTPDARARIEHLRRTLGDPAATAAERQAAREELVRLLMHPSRAGAPVAPMPPRAAIDPSLPLKPATPALPATPVITPVAPPVRAPNPVPDGKGGTVAPTGKTAVDPKTGATLIDTGNGWLDPATGRFVPKN
jgi:hypothetical protein